MKKNSAVSVFYVIIAAIYSETVSLPQSMGIVLVLGGIAVVALRHKE